MSQFSTNLHEISRTHTWQILKNDSPAEEFMNQLKHSNDIGETVDDYP